MAADQSTLVPKFAGRKTFPLRYGWLKKAVDGVGDDPELFTRDDALVSLGVGKNIVRSIRHWALANRVLDEDADTPNNRGRKRRRADFGIAVLRLFLGADTASAVMIAGNRRCRTARVTVPLHRRSR